MDSLIYKPFKEGQEYIVSDMVWDVFCEFEAPGYPEEGVNTFKEFIEPQRLADQVKNNGFKVYCCFDKDDLVGVIALRSITHISLLFVKKSHQRKGIAKKLLELATEEIIKENPNAKELTVNSSPYAVEIYKRLGFIPTDVMQKMNGIIYMPMKKL